MSVDAEKVINLSLCKMAESRGIRRGGSSLHKHLLIASVLTKARSAYFENWYLGDNDCSSVGTDGVAIESSGAAGASDQAALNQILDPSFFVEVEAEIELPSDILNCVEKLGDMTDFDVDLNPRVREEDEMLSEAGDDQVSSSTTTDMVQGDTESDKSRTESEMKYTYLDLDSSKEVSQSPKNVPVPTNSLPSLFPGISSSSSPPAPQSTCKRRRDWSYELDDDSDDEDEDRLCSASPDLKPKLKSPGTSTRSIHHISKRLRSSVSSNSTNSSDSFCSSSTPSLPLPIPAYNFEGNHFRTKKPHFDADEQEDASGATDGDSFVDDDEDDWCEAKGKSCDRNDRRVPSASSSGSSDEEQDLGCSMEVDQITNLVQYFSFQKHQQENLAPVGFANGTKTSSGSPPSHQSNLSRSMSTPDLCSRSGNNTNNSSGNSISCPKTKDLFSTYGLTSSHRVLTMKV